MATLALTFSDLYDRVSQFLGTYGSSGASGQNLTDAKQIVNDAYTKFITAREWSFLKPMTTLTTIKNKWIYTMPDDFQTLLSDFSFDSDSQFADIQEISVDTLMSQRNVLTRQQYPDAFAKRVAPPSNELGTMWEILFDPIPDAAYLLHYRYRAMPTKLVNDVDIPSGGIESAQLLRQMCIAEAELAKDKKIGPQQAVAQQMLGTAIVEDAKRNPHNIGRNGNGTRLSAWEAARGSYRINDVNYVTD